MNRHLQNLVLGGNQQSLEPTIKSMAKVLCQTQRNVVSHVGIFYSSTLLSSRYLRPFCRFKRGFTQYFLSEQFDNSAQRCLAFLTTLSDLTFKHMILPIKVKMDYHLLYIAIYQLFSKLPSERHSIRLTGLAYILLAPSYWRILPQTPTVSVIPRNPLLHTTSLILLKCKFSCHFYL